MAADQDQREASRPGAGASGGLSGFMQALRAMGETKEDIDDPEALRRAEAAMGRDAEPPAVSSPPIDGSWQRVAVQDGSSGLIGLQDVARSLESEGIPFGWDPFEPNAAVEFTPPSAVKRPFALQVPASRSAQARKVLYGVPPQGVSYPWEAGEFSASPSKTDSEFSSEFSTGNATSAPQPRAGDPKLSDNQRMERMAGGRGSGIGAAIGVVFFIVAILAGLSWLASR